MSIKQKTKKPHTTVKRHPAIIVGLILLMAIVALIVAKLLAMNNAGEPESNIVDEEISQVEPQGATQSEIPMSEEGDGKTPLQYEGSNPNTSGELTGFINYNSISGDKLLIRATIDQFISGTCDLVMTANGKTVTRSVNIVNTPTASVCDGFDIPVAELSSGTWQINIKLTSGDKTGTITGEASL